MAKIGTTTGRWTKTTDREDGSGSVRRLYGLRNDGVLLRKVTYLNADGSVDFAGSWTIVGRNPKVAAGMIEDLTMRLGFEEVQ